MPSKSASQHRLMEAAAHTPGGYGGIPQSVGKEFVAADKAEGKFKGKRDTRPAQERHPRNHAEFEALGRD